MKCIKCGWELADSAKFCAKCGAKQPEKADYGYMNNGYDNSGYTNNGYDNSGYAENGYGNGGYAENGYGSGGYADNGYGSGGYAENGYGNTGYAENGYAGNSEKKGMSGKAKKKAASGKSKNKSKSKSKKVPLIVGSGVVVAAAAVVGIVYFAGGIGGASGGSKDVSDQYVQYVKDFSLNVIDTDSRKMEPTILNSNIYYTDSDLTVKYSDDGKYMYYPSDYDGYTFALNRIKVGADPEKAERIDSSASEFWILPDQKILYLRDDTLYVSDAKGNKEKVSANVDFVYLNEDRTYILWLDYSDNNASIYCQDVKLKKEKVKLASDAVLCDFSDSFDRLIIMQDDILYKIDDFGEKVKIESGVTAYCGMSEDGHQIYYSKYNEGVLKASDLVEDDMAEADAQMTSPNMDDYVKESVEKNGDKYEKVETMDWDAYQAAWDEYYAKESRDYLRENLEDYEISTYFSELRVYTDGQSETISDQMTSFLGSGKEAFVYSTADVADLEKIKLSEISYASEVKELYDEKLEAATETWIYNDGTTLELDVTYDGAYCRFSDDGFTGYLVNYSGENTQLYAFDVETGANLTEISDNLYMICEITNDGIYYISDVYEDSNGSYDGDLYFNGELIDTDVRGMLFGAIEGTDTIYYGTDVSSDDTRFTLRLYGGSGSPVTVADDVSQAVVLDKDKIVLLQDYSLSSGKGDLKLYKGKNELKTLDEEVSCILSPDIGM